MYVKHLGADMRLHRARQMRNEVARLGEEYLASDAVRLEPAYAPDGSRAHRLRVREAPPESISRLAGESIRTARAALDDLAISLVVASRRTPRHTCFPIADSARDFPHAEDAGLRRANEKARGAVRSVTPWKGGDDTLWELHDLAAAESAPVVHLGQVVARAGIRVPTALQVLQVAAPRAGARHPLVDSSVIPAEGEQATSVEAGLRIVFGSGHLVRGHPVVESLDLLIARAADVVERVVAAAEAH